MTVNVDAMALRKHTMCAWNLTGHVDSPSTPEMALPNDTETVFLDDHRRKVEREDLDRHPDRLGKYRSIVKLRSVYQDPVSGRTESYGATGWLIASDDLVVTAAHTVCDVGNPKRLAFRVEVQVGCNDDIPIEEVQHGLGEKVLIPQRWLSSGSGSSRLYDFAFVKLGTPFKDIVPLEYANTPPSGDKVIGVVGYPGDKGNDVERGSQMYEQFDNVIWDIRKTGGLLTYPISTFSGNSGSPVLLQTETGLVAIATHTGGYSCSQNRASPIGTRLFNSYGKIIERFFSGIWPEPDRVFSLPNSSLNVELHNLTEAPSSDELHDKNHFSAASADAEMVYVPTPSESKTPDSLRLQ